MKLYLTGDIEGLLEGIDILSADMGICLSEDGIPVKVEKYSGNIQVTLENGKGLIKYSEKIHFYRALGLFVEQAIDKESFSIIEEPQFSLNGAMIDVSRNAVLKIESVKYTIRKMAIMGLNTIMLYTEDTYEIKELPYFGYMRGRYTAEELKECDDYAYIFGIEIIPCIQTLAHLTQALKWSYASNICDTADILLAGEEKTYEFIENMIKSASAPFRSRRIHIGMDEAHSLGLGRYLDMHGYRRRFDIMNEHLERVVDIVKKYDLKPMIWSDMYFRLASKTGAYYDKDAVIPEDVKKNCNKDVQLVYWDYYHSDEDTYKEFIRRHISFGNEMVFAGGVWTWAGMMINYNKTFITTNSALSACKQEGVKEVFATMWGDNGAETNFFTALLGLQLYAEHGYSKELDVEKLKKRFKFCTGEDCDAFMSLSELDNIPGAAQLDMNLETSNPSKFLLWQDILIGLFDKEIEGLNLKEHYSLAAEKMRPNALISKDFKEIFVFAQKLAEVLSIKADMGLRLKKAYDEKDISTLRKIAELELQELYMEVNKLRILHRQQWLATNKPFGWEIIDIRYGGLLARINSTIDRITDFVSGKASKLEELEAARLRYHGEYTEGVGRCNIYNRIISASPLG
jgi:hexosaminidase